MLRGVLGSGGGAAVGGTGTTNTIPRWTGPSTLGDSVITQSGNNIGVGEPSPTTRLQVQGLANTTAFYVVGSSTVGQSYGALISAGTNASDRSFAVSNSGNTSTYLFVRGDGNVGIGTASPGALLDVNTGTAAGSYVTSTRLSQTGTAANSGQRILFHNSAQAWDQGAIGSLREGANNNFALTFFTSIAGTNTERARIDSSGNVGIGTASPSAPLTFGKAVYAAPTSEDFYRIKVEDFGGIANDVGFGSPASGSLGINWSSSGSLIFYQANAAVAERARFDTSGNLILNSANTGATIQAAGSQQGLKLPATPGNADTQTLDCYQENTGWVPTITFGGASTGMTYTTQAGSWTKIGNLVFVTGRIVLSAKGSSTGVARLANLPVAVGASNASGGGMVGPVANITFGGQLAIYAVASATTLGLAKNTSGGAAVDLTDADFTNTSDITFSCIYRV